jgi:hypothetical protein
MVGFVGLSHSGTCRQVMRLCLSYRVIGDSRRDGAIIRFHPQIFILDKISVLMELLWSSPRKAIKCRLEPLASFAFVR